MAIEIIICERYLHSLQHLQPDELAESMLNFISFSNTFIRLEKFDIMGTKRKTL